MKRERHTRSVTVPLTPRLHRGLMRLSGAYGDTLAGHLRYLLIRDMAHARIVAQAERRRRSGRTR